MAGRVSGGLAENARYSTLRPQSPRAVCPKVFSPRIPLNHACSAPSAPRARVRVALVPTGRNAQNPCGTGDSSTERSKSRRLPRRSSGLVRGDVTLVGEGQRDVVEALEQPPPCVVVDVERVLDGVGAGAC